MGWINVRWGMPQVLDASTNLPHKAMLYPRQGGKTKTCFLVPNFVHN